MLCAHVHVHLRTPVAVGVVFCKVHALHHRPHVETLVGTDVEIGDLLVVEEPRCDRVEPVLFRAMESIARRTAELPWQRGVLELLASVSIAICRDVADIRAGALATVSVPHVFKRDPTGASSPVLYHVECLTYSPLKTLLTTRAC